MSAKKSSEAFYGSERCMLNREVQRGCCKMCLKMPSSRTKVTGKVCDDSYREQVPKWKQLYLHENELVWLDGEATSYQSF